MLRTFLLVALFASGPIFSAEGVPTLAGDWVGKWTDSRTEYNGSGGEFNCHAVADGNGAWHAEFSLGKGKTLNAALKGQLESGAIVFDTTVNLGEFYGAYKFKGRIRDGVFRGEYSGPGEQGMFTMTRK